MNANYPSSITYKAEASTASVFCFALKNAGIKESDFQKVAGVMPVTCNRYLYKDMQTFRLIRLLKLMGYNEIIVIY